MNITLNIANASQLNSILDALLPDTGLNISEIEPHEAAIADVKAALYAADDNAYKAFKAAIADHMALPVYARNRTSVVSGWVSYFTTEAHAQAFAFFMGGYSTLQVVGKCGDLYAVQLGKVSCAGTDVYNAATKPVELVEKRVF